MFRVVPPFFMQGVLAYVAMLPSLGVGVEMLSLTGADRGASLASLSLIMGLSALFLSWWTACPLVFSPGPALFAFYAYTVYWGEGSGIHGLLMISALAGLLILIIGVSGLGGYLGGNLPSFFSCALAVGLGFLFIETGCRYAGILVPHPVTLVTTGDFTSRSFLILAAGLTVTLIFLLTDRRWPLLAGFGASALAGIIVSVTPWSFPSRVFPSMPDPSFLNTDAGVLFQGYPWALLITIYMASELFALTLAAGKRFAVTKKQINKTFTVTGLFGIAAPFFGVPAPGLSMEAMTAHAEGTPSHRSGYVVAALCLVTAATPFLFDLLGRGYDIGSQTRLYPVTAVLFIGAGLLQLGFLREIRWDDAKELIPAGLICVVTVMSRSVMNGLMAGIFSYALVETIQMRRPVFHPLLFLMILFIAMRYLF